jgi:hypothetical protein
VTDSILKFPNSKRCLTRDEERVLKQCVNLIELSFANTNPFVKKEQRLMQTENIVRECIRKIFELNED